MYSVQWDVVLLRRNGMRLRPAELDPPIRGLLHIGDNPQGGTFKRLVRVAELINVEALPQTRYSTLLPLFDPVVVRVDELTGMLHIAGIQLHTADKRTYEAQQVWRCTPVFVPPPPSMANIPSQSR